MKLAGHDRQSNDERSHRSIRTAMGRHTEIHRLLIQFGNGNRNKAKLGVGAKATAVKGRYQRREREQLGRQDA